MSGRDWQAFDTELRARMPELAVELLGKPSFKAGQEWRWGRKGSLSVVVSGDKAGMWFDHEAGDGGGFVDLVGRYLGLSRGDANDWIADRIGMAIRHRRVGRRAGASAPPANEPHRPPAPPCADSLVPAPGGGDDRATMRTDEAAARAVRIWAMARPAPTEHPYLAAKQAAPLTLRMDARGQLVVPLQDVGGRLHSLETIAHDGAKRFLAGGAKRGHFAVVGAEPGPLRLGLLQAVGLTPEDCRAAATLERRRMRNAGLLAGHVSGRAPQAHGGGAPTRGRALGTAGTLRRAVVDPRRSAGGRP